MQLVNGVQFLNITLFLVLFVEAPAADVLSTVIVPLTSILFLFYKHSVLFSQLMKTPFSASKYAYGRLNKFFCSYRLHKTATI